MNFIFLLSNKFVLTGWLLLLVAPKWKYTSRISTYICVLLLSVIYSIIIIHTLSGFDWRSFSTLQNVRQLFQSDEALLAGWIHYLAFDLFMGVYILKQTQEYKIPHLFNLFLLPLTFLFGPLGYTVFMSIKIYKLKNGTH
jgi:hypothetical protein